MKELDVRYANHPEDSKHYTTEELRKHYLIENVFVENRWIKIHKIKT